VPPRIRKLLDLDYLSWASPSDGSRAGDLRAAEESIAADHGVGLEDIAVLNDRSVQLVAREMMTFAGWL